MKYILILAVVAILAGCTINRFGGICDSSENKLHNWGKWKELDVTFRSCDKCNIIQNYAR